ncbi:conserved hypothetical protein [Uncinocarpus reesii 1704]|uniref:Phosphoribosyltransferase domain-containing protein n=1 Tax=Uncinocarpus reesii (strain UAMH 1704) TaxID=336963 RepID=C4JD99_UNCRE|nr:uncharacterized protein UREG_00300 [Uncinocarpus reesii 1704]EEP75454.1 conserved hypothetical protein [Uncinocarpus reesii 1704]
MIASLVPGGLEAFQKLDEQGKIIWRQRAIDTIRKHCSESGRTAVVAGHFMFWPSEEETGNPNRPSISVTHICKWQKAEESQLRYLCRENGILFSLLPAHLISADKVSAFLRDFRGHTEKYNLVCAESTLDAAVDSGNGRLETMLVMDADRTLSPEDTGVLFWEELSASRRFKNNDPLKALFDSPLAYSYAAFRQATLLYEEAADDEEFNAVCDKVASAVVLYPEIVALLRQVERESHVGAVVVTCGLRRVWEKVLEREGLSEKVMVIGGGRIADGFVVTPSVKGALVAKLRNHHQMYVWAFGDSPGDLDMLHKANQAVVVVGDKQGRSKIMDEALIDSIDNKGLQASQAVLGNNTSPRLDASKLPIVQLTGREFMESIIRRRKSFPGPRIWHGTDRNAAKLLATQMRDAKVAGPDLREAHRRAGWYLATETLADILGVEECPIQHVLGRPTSGYRLLNESQTLIVALMRGGEPMAFGVNDAFPLAMFLHARSPDDIKQEHLQGRLTVLLVDSVVNSGKTVIEFLHHVRRLHGSIRIMVVAGVAQSQSLSKGSDLTRALNSYTNVGLVTLRISDTKFTGKGANDTGNRLFNTTHLP